MEVSPSEHNARDTPCPVCKKKTISGHRTVLQTFWALEKNIGFLGALLWKNTLILGPLFTSIWVLTQPFFLDTTLPFFFFSLGLDEVTTTSEWLKTSLWLIFGLAAVTVVFFQVFFYFEKNMWPTWKILWTRNHAKRRLVFSFFLLFGLSGLRHLVKDSFSQGLCKRPTTIVPLPTKAARGAILPPSYLSTQSFEKGDHMQHQEMHIGTCQTFVKHAGYAFQTLIPHNFWISSFHYILEGLLTLIGLYLAVRFSLAPYFVLKKIRNPWKTSVRYSRGLVMRLLFGLLILAVSYGLLREVLTKGLATLWPAGPHMILEPLMLFYCSLVGLVAYALYIVQAAHNIVQISEAKSISMSKRHDLNR